MIDIKLIREDSKGVKKNSKNRGYDEKDVDDVIKLDKKWREMKNEDDNLRHERNKVSQEINKAKKGKDNARAGELIKQAKKISEKLKQNEEEEGKLREEIDKLISVIPNIQTKDVPVGEEDKNKEIHKKGKIKKGKVKGHLEIGKLVDGIDIERATKISGAGFYVLKGDLAKLQRGLINFMLDLHVKDGFVEINSPQLVNSKTMFGTGNLPKFEHDAYKTREGLYLIPTAEVPVTNLHAGEVLNEKDLPKKYCAFTECYRTEAGKHAGEEGLFRLHQFEKVEMVYICKEEDSWDLLEEMTKQGEKILESLKIPYRRILLSTGDSGFASAKTYDLEVWSPAMGRWLECSSCSNCTDFQARRMNLRYQGKDGLKFCHTLNGSGLALPRLIITLIENNQMKDGSIKIPKVLWKYTGFKVIEAGGEKKVKKVKKKVARKKKKIKKKKRVKKK